MRLFAEHLFLPEIVTPVPELAGINEQRQLVTKQAHRCCDAEQLEQFGQGTTI